MRSFASIASSNKVNPKSTTNNSYWHCLLTENKDHLPDILQSITHYISHDALANDQKGGFQVLHRMSLLWVTSYQDPSAPPPAPSPSPVKPVLSNSMSSSNIAPPPILLVSPVPGFEQFLYNGAVKLCFEIPLERKFDYSDAASFAVRSISFVRSSLSRLLLFLHFATLAGSVCTREVY